MLQNCVQIISLLKKQIRSRREYPTQFPERYLGNLIMFCKMYSRSQSTVFICFQVCVSKIYVPIYIVYTHINFFKNVLSSFIGLAVPVWTTVSTVIFIGILLIFGLN